MTFVTLCNGGEDNLFRFHRNLILWSGQDFGDFSRGSVFLRRHLSISRNYFFRVFNLFFFVVVRNVSLASSIANCSWANMVTCILIVKQKKSTLNWSHIHFYYFAKYKVSLGSHRRCNVCFLSFLELLSRLVKIIKLLDKEREYAY